MTLEKPAPRAKVRKIFKKGEVYQCGLCGSTFSNLADVTANLKECTKTYLADGGTIESAPKRYRCVYCKRIYDSIEDAKSCSVMCKKGIEARMTLEERAAVTQNAQNKMQVLAKFAKDPAALAALNTAKTEMNHVLAPPLKKYVPKKAEILSGENVKFVREKNQFRCLKCKQRYSAAEDARSCWDGHGETYVSHVKAKSTDPRYTLDGKKFRCTKCERLYAGVDDVVNCYQSHDVKVVGKTKKEGEQEAFYRDGAKYVCRKCGKKYFSRDEVVSCFETGGEAPVDGTPPPQAPAPKEPAAPISMKSSFNKKDDSEKFFRDGAKYVCRGCSKKYFSRDETLTCFDSHAQE